MENLTIIKFEAGQPIYAEPFNDMADKINELVEASNTANEGIGTKQETIEDLETIRSGAAAGATALQSFTEADPIFTSSPASEITKSQITLWDASAHTHSNKAILDKITETPLFQKDLPNLDPYALDSELKKVEAILGHGTIAAEGDNEEQAATGICAVVERLSGSSLTADSLTDYATQQYVAEKIAEVVGEDINADFDTLKEVADWILNDTTGAAKLQSDVAELKAINHDEFLKAADVENKADKSEIPSLEGYAKSTDIPSLEGYAKLTDIPSLDTYVQEQDLPDFEEYAKKSELPENYLTSEDLEGYVKDTDLENFVESSELDSYAKKEDIPSLEDYAKSEDIPSTEGLLSMTDAEELYQPKGDYLIASSIKRLAIKDMVEDTCVKRTKVNDDYQIFVHGQHIEFKLKNPDAGLTSGTGLTSWLRHIISNGLPIGNDVYKIVSTCGDITSVSEHSGSATDNPSEVDVNLATFFANITGKAHKDIKMSDLMGKDITMEIGDDEVSVMYKIIVD